MRRVLIYAAIYGSIGVAIGVCLALYTRDMEAPKTIALNGSHATASTGEDATPVQATPIVEEN